MLLSNIWICLDSLNLLFVIAVMIIQYTMPFSSSRELRIFRFVFIYILSVFVLSLSRHRFGESQQPSSGSGRRSPDVANLLLNDSCGSGANALQIIVIKGNHRPDCLGGNSEWRHGSAIRTPLSGRSGSHRCMVLRSKIHTVQYSFGKIQPQSWRCFEKKFNLE